jgi:hypothetical protein
VIGPVTVPSKYSYSTTEPAGAGYWGTWFYIGDGADDYTWNAYFTPEGNNNPAPPTLWVPPRSLGANAVTIAPAYIYDATLQESHFHLYVLTPPTGSGGNDRLVQEYESESDTWHNVQDSSGNDVYVWGVATDRTNGTFWGWTHFSGTEGGNTWLHDGTSGVIEEPAWPGFTSIAPLAPNSVFTSLLSVVVPNTPVTPPGDQVDYFDGTVPDGTWTADTIGGYTFGAAQLTTDSILGVLYGLDANGVVWTYQSNFPYELPTSQCGSSAELFFVQIAAKNGIVFALNSPGTVWYFTTAANCWAKVGTMSDFAYSIATDNGDFTGVWASDTDGKIWTAE